MQSSSLLRVAAIVSLFDVLINSTSSFSARLVLYSKKKAIKVIIMKAREESSSNSYYNARIKSTRFMLEQRKRKK